MPCSPVGRQGLGAGAAALFVLAGLVMVIPALRGPFELMVGKLANRGMRRLAAAPDVPGALLHPAESRLYRLVGPGRPRRTWCASKCGGA